MKSRMLLWCLIVVHSIQSKYLLIGLATPYELRKTRYDHIKIRSDISKAGVRSMNVGTDYDSVAENDPTEYHKALPGTLNTQYEV